MIEIEDNKVRDNCHITGKYRGVQHWSCNINLKISKKLVVIFHNLKGYDSHLIFKELSKFNCSVSVIANDCNGIRTLNHLVRKRTLNHLAKLAKMGIQNPVAVT